MNYIIKRTLHKVMLVLMLTIGCMPIIIKAQGEIKLAMNISRPNSVTLKQTNVQLKCSVASFDKIMASSNTCKFIMPSSKEITLNYNNGTATGARGIKGQVNHCRRTCGITIEVIAQEHIGQWSCIMNDKAPFRKGTFSIVTEGCVKGLKNERLPYHAVPHNYELTLIPILEKGNFTAPGKVKIHFTTAKAIEDVNIRRIVIHSKDINIKEDTVRVTNSDGTPFANISTHEHDLERQFYVVHLDSSLKPSTNYSLFIEFISNVNKEVEGLFQGSFIEDSEEKWMAATHFEDIQARRAFPCLDEPDRKATFDVKVGHKADHVAFSNMPIVSSSKLDDPPDYQLDTFQRSPIMSSYLVAFVIGDFGRTSSPNDPSFSIIHVKSKASQARYAADFGQKIMKYYETYLDYKYPLPKMDMVALPYFFKGGTENWGLITYLESVLLYDEGVTSLSEKENIEIVIAHELAHQWFGNLVTMKLWNDIWLNEGFAPYMQVIGDHFMLPQNELPDRILLDSMHAIFGDDALETSQPVSGNADDPGNYHEHAMLSYSKGLCLIRMVENILTKTTFIKGINRYLKAYAYSNAVRENLWEHLEASAKEDGTLTAPFSIQEIMEDWLAVAGYPVVKVSKGEENQYTLKQERFLLNSTAAPVDTKWFIPITIATPGTGAQNNTHPTKWMSSRQDSFSVEIKSSPFIINVKQTGYYRVNYNTENWFAIIGTLIENYKNVEKLNRAQLLDDSFNLARANQIGYDIPFAMLEYLQHEDQFVPLQAGLNSIIYLDRMLRHSLKDYVYLQNYIKEVFLPIYTRLGFDSKENDGYLTELLRNGLIDVMCLYQHEDCITKAEALFGSWMKNQDPDNVNPIPPDLKQTIYKTAIRNGNEKEFDFLWKRYLSAQQDAERSNILYGLVSSQNKELLKVLLGKTLDDTSGLQFNSILPLYEIMFISTATGRRVVFDWLKDNFDDFKAHFGTRYIQMASIIANFFLSESNTNEEIAEAKAFIAANHLPEIPTLVTREDTPFSVHDTMLEWPGRAIKQAKQVKGGKGEQGEQGISNPYLNVQWMENNYNEVVAWLQQHATIKTTQPTTPNKQCEAICMVPLSVLLSSVVLQMLIF